VAGEEEPGDEYGRGAPNHCYHESQEDEPKSVYDCHTECGFWEPLEKSCFEISLFVTFVAADDSTYRIDLSRY